MQPALLGHGDLVERLGLLRHPLEPALGLFEVGEQQLGLDRLDVRERIDAAVGVHDARVVVHAHHVQDRVGLADVGEELVAEPLALVGPADQAGDVVELDRLVHDRPGADGRGHAVEPLVRDADHRHVRLDRGERVVGRLRPGPGERVEERGLAGVREPDDADLHGVRSLPMASPSRAPATMSVG